MLLKKTICTFFFIYVWLFTPQKIQAQAMTCNRHQTSYQCLVCNCYHESRGEPNSGKIAVAKAVMTRTGTKGYAGSVCGVVWQYHQFSWTWDNIPDNISPQFPADKDGFQECKHVADIALREGGNGIVNFYAGPRPYWAGDYKFCAKVGKHNFLVKAGNKCPRDVTASAGAVKAGLSAGAGLKGKVGGKLGVGIR